MTCPRTRRDARPLASWLWLLLVAAASAAGAEFDWGFLASRLEDPNGDLRLRVLGPFFERTRSPKEECLTAARPLFARVTDPAAERRLTEIAWPLFMARDFRNQRNLRMALLAHFTDFDTTDPGSRYRFWVLPVYFQGRDAKGRSYLGIFPLGGTIHEFLGRDEMAFVLFPLYGYGSVNEVRTHSVLWPVYSRTRGKGIYRFRVFPFYGQAQHRHMFSKGFVLWPFWTWARYTYPDASGTGYILFPLWGRFKMPDQEAWLILPPLFRFSRGERMNYSYAPWPFVQTSSGEIEKLYLWPIWGKRSMRGIRSAFFLWPIFRTEREDRGEVVRRTFRALPLVYSEVDATPSWDAGRQVKKRYHKVWPLISFRQEGAARRVRLLELWPLQHTGPIERNFAPFWTLFTWSEVGERAETEVLWGLYRHRRRGPDARTVSLFPAWEWSRDDRGDGVREWQVLKGLVGRRRDERGVSYRWLYFIRLGGPGRRSEKEKNHHPT